MQVSMPPIAVLLEKLFTAGITIPPGPVRADGYGDSAELSDALIELIRSGPKRAGTGLLWAIEHDQESIPKVGDLEIVVNHQFEPVLVTRITRVEILPFNLVSAEYAAIEGEGDGSLDYWRQGHWRFFSRECARIGREPSQGMPVVCSVFELVAAVPRNAA
jgi:uncharacterized protein YhfF